MTDFAKKTAVVTGGGQGIGRAIAEALLRAGGRVFLAEIDAEAGDEACQELSALGPVEFVDTDVADPVSVQALHRRVETGGGLDLLVNNAGIMARKPLSELGVEEWQRVIGVNLTGAS
jgi:NAD(P)-dependent dehydrogenase (short-subunit alcohol dehydrogenase family)